MGTDDTNHRLGKGVWWGTTIPGTVSLREKYVSKVSVEKGTLDNGVGGGEDDLLIGRDRRLTSVPM